MKKGIKGKAARVAIGTFLMCMPTVGSYQTLTVYVVPLSKHFGVGIGQISLLFSFFGIGGVIAALLLGKVSKTFPIKSIVTFAGLCVFACFGLIAYSPNLWSIYLGAFLSAFSVIWGGVAISHALITWWFVAGRGKVLGALPIGTGLFGIFMTPTIASLIKTYGFQHAAIVEGTIAGLWTIIVGLFVLVEHPDKYGLKPLGYAEMENEVTQKNTDMKTSMSVKQILGTSAFWLIIMASLSIDIAKIGFIDNASPFYQSIGLDAIKAAFAISIYQAASMAWGPIFGVLVDKFGPRAAISSLVIIGAATFFSSTILTGWISAVIFAICIGSISINILVGPVTFPRVFGTKEAGSLVGFSHAAGGMGTIIGVPLAGFLFDSFGSYRNFMIICGFLMIITVILILLATSKKTLNKIKLNEVEFQKVKASESISIDA